MRQYGEEIRGRVRELHQQRCGIDSLHSQGRGGRQTRGDRLRTLHGRQQLRVLRAGPRVHQTTPRGREVFGNQGFAIRPARQLSQVKSIANAVSGDRALIGGGQHRRAIRAYFGQAFIQVAQDGECRLGARTVRVETLRLRAVAAAQDHRARFRGNIAMPPGECGGQRRHDCGKHQRRQHRPRPRNARHLQRGAELQAARSRFLRCTSSSDTAAGVRPGIRAA